MQNVKHKAFVSTVQKYYKEHGRHALPWRQTRDPYKILVSEVMLQQTQVDRVVPKYKAFLKRFPSVETLAQAPLSEVLSLWSGLGYNRRAKHLHMAAQRIREAFGGVFPSAVATLESLPGVGPYTARAVATFAFNIEEYFVETNIRTVFIYHFFKNAQKVPDKAILECVKATFPKGVAPRLWYAALMDYGTHLKQQGIKTHRVSSTYKKQSPFKGSKRALRGAVIKTLVKSSCTRGELEKQYSVAVHQIIDTLIQEGFIMEKRGRLALR